MRIGIIGYGVVGKAINHTLEKEYEIVKYDKFVELDNFDNLLSCDFVFISVPTPFDCQKNVVDDAAIDESLELLSLKNYKGIVIIKSTVTFDLIENYLKKYNLDIAFNPEFLRESTTPNEDFSNQIVIVIGTDSKTIFGKIKKMYLKVTLPHAVFYHTSIREASMIKYSQNTMLASRVALANMIFEACESSGISYNKISEIAFSKFDILGPHMILVPGPDGKKGFGGKCLPKDIRGFSTIYQSELLNQIISYNDELRDDLSTVLKNFKKKK